MDWYKGGPGSDVSGMKSIAPFIGTTVSKGYPGGPELGVLADAKARADYRRQEAMPGIRDKIKNGDVEGAVAQMQELGIAPGLQKYYIQTTQNPAARMTKRQMQDFMRTASPEEKIELERAQRNRPAETSGSAPHAAGGRITARADGGSVDGPRATYSANSDFSGQTAQGFPLGRHVLDVAIPLTSSTDLTGRVGFSPNLYGPDQHDFQGRIGLRSRFANGGRVEPNNINHAPTEAQKHAGNYAKDHVKIHGLDITIENAKGKPRRGVGSDGKPWSAILGAHYGYFKKTEAKDGDHVDCYLGPHIKSPHVFVIDQVDHKTDKYDEAKCCLGFANERQALRAYEAGFSDGKGKDRIGKVTAMTVQQFKDWLKHGNTKAPFNHAKREIA